MNINLLIHRVHYFNFQTTMKSAKRGRGEEGRFVDEDETKPSRVARYSHLKAVTSVLVFDVHMSFIFKVAMATSFIV